MEILQGMVSCYTTGSQKAKEKTNTAAVQMSDKLKGRQINPAFLFAAKAFDSTSQLSCE